MSKYFHKGDAVMFPAPREVDRYLYRSQMKKVIAPVRFPAPREVDRELYKRNSFWRCDNKIAVVSGPSRGR